MSKRACVDEGPATRSAHAETPGFQCCFTQDIIVDPVLCLGDGFSYERTEIEQWFRRGNTRSPTTNQELQNTTLIDNHNLRQAIHHYHPDAQRQYEELREAARKQALNAPVDGVGRTKLFVAAASGNEATVGQLLAAGAAVDQVMTGIGWSSLFVAAWGGHAGVVEVLLRSSADQTVATTADHWGVPAGSTAEAVAEEKGHGAVLGLLRSG